MDQYFNQMEKIVKERKTSSRIRFMLQDVIDLRLVSRKINLPFQSLQGLAWGGCPRIYMYNGLMLLPHDSEHGSTNCDKRAMWKDKEHVHLPVCSLFLLSILVIRPLCNFEISHSDFKLWSFKFNLSMLNNQEFSSSKSMYVSSPSLTL